MLGIFFLGTFRGSKLNIESNFINLVMVFYLRQEKFRFIKNKRINILINDSERKPMINGLRAQVCTINCQKDLGVYDGLNEADKKLWQLDTSIEGLLELAIATGQDPLPLNDLKSELKEKLFSVDLPLFKNDFVGPNGKRKILGRIRPELRKNTFLIRYLDERDQIISEITFFEGLPRYFYFSKLFKQGEWINENEFKIVNESNDFSILFDLDKGTNRLNLESSMLTISQVENVMKGYSIENEEWKKFFAEEFGC
jgi:hypothetical protein